MTETWFDANDELIEPDELSAIDEILARLRGYHDGPLQAFLEAASRWEQGLKPVVLSAGKRRLAAELMRLPADYAVVKEALFGIGVKPARRLLRQVLVEWRKPKRTQEELRPYLQRRSGEILWLLEEVGVGVTGVQVEVSISGTLAGEIPAKVFRPVLEPNVEEPETLSSWWTERWTSRDVLHLADDVGTPYTLEVATEGYSHFPLRVRVEGQILSRSPWAIATGYSHFPLRVWTDGQWQTRVIEQFSCTFVPGVPLNAQSLTLSGSIDLRIEQPSGEAHPWLTTDVTLGDFSYTIDLAGWWPGVVKKAQSRER